MYELVYMFMHGNWLKIIHVFTVSSNSGQQNIKPSFTQPIQITKYVKCENILSENTQISSTRKKMSCCGWKMGTTEKKSYK